MEQWIRDRIAAGRKLFFNAVAETPEGYMTDQELRKPQPPLAKAPMTGNILDLQKGFRDLDIENDFLHIINTRKSHRVYTDQPIPLTALSYLLWCTQGVKSVRGKSYATLRTVPGGARLPNINPTT